MIFVMFYFDAFRPVSVGARAAELEAQKERGFLSLIFLGYAQLASEPTSGEVAQMRLLHLRSLVFILATADGI